MILKHGMTDEEILKEMKSEMKQKEIEQTDKNTNEILETSRQILKMMNNYTEIEYVLQKGIKPTTRGSKMTIVDIGCHPKNFFDCLHEIVDLCKHSQISEMQLAGLAMHREIEKLEDYMMKHRIEDTK